ncbi:tetratricopeptide repeat protein [Beggiatoa leptomitoformis]|uniref:Tetratricopeptide repeat protein n=1 Tax=Beggiatoa leptomitoformis TaxID=288004 RepID=A0A2N9YD55_9GAMM|nr:tetratricopeptide repeat protein [Beggiatoa leptomitoformis]ALG69151.1 tetratricopeptide repeat protein [Beggiatoa leptomitoformis]AUI68428.1 tetratricopeptide repeat protein [Beggiatoa leptomitoformis]
MQAADNILWSQHPELSALLWSLQNGEGFNLYICQYTTIPYRQQLTALLTQQHPIIEISILSLAEQQLIDEGLQTALQNIPTETAVFIYDLERLLLTIDQQKNLRYVRQLNWRRSAFQRLQRSLVLWLPHAALDLLARYAPDFYDWCSGFYYFAEPQTTTIRFEPKAFESDKTFNLSLTDKQNWLAVLQESLQDISLQEPERAKVLRDIGDLQYAMGNYQEADAHFQQSLKIFKELNNEAEVAETRGRIADILYRRGELAEALRIRQEEEMPVYERLGDVRSRAVTLGQIADILQARGELAEALRIRQEEEMPVYERLGDVRSRAVTLGQIADILYRRGELAEALRIRQEEEMPVYERLGDVRERAVTLGQIADILQARGELAEALRIRQEEEMPVYERLGDVRERAVTLGKIADILQARGELAEALRILQEELIPVFERLGDVRSRAACFGRIADILQARGELAEALRIRQEEEMPVYERLGDVRSRAVTLGKIADILQARGELAEALRIRQEEQMPVYERLGDVRSRAVTLGKIADILQARGELAEALRIRQEEQMPVYERLGDVRGLLITQWKIALQFMVMTPPRRAEANQLLCLALQSARKMQIPEAGQIEAWLQHFGMDC